jgi:hypothetical protein
MGSMTYENFSDELNFLLGNRNDPEALNADRVSRWINHAYIYMCHPSVHHFREMQSIGTIPLVSGTNEYPLAALPGSLVAIRFVTHVVATSYSPTANKRKLDPRGIRWFEQRTLAIGRPFLYTIDGSTLFIAGVPGLSEIGQLLRIGYYKVPTALSGGIGTVLGAYYDRPLMKFAEAFAEADLGDKALALITLKEAGGLLNNAVSENELEAEDSGFKTEMILQSAMGF